MLFKLFLRGSMLDTLGTTNKKTMNEIHEMNEADKVNKNIQVL